jgi:hypothetical protein
MEWAARWGFGILIGLALVAAACVAWRLDPPARIPSIALQAAPVYRLEVGAAVFVAAYVAATALVLALNNRAFTEVGTGGVKAHDVGGPTRREMAQEQQQELLALARIVADLRRISPQGADEGNMIEPDDDK